MKHVNKFLITFLLLFFISIPVFANPQVEDSGSNTNTNTNTTTITTTDSNKNTNSSSNQSNITPINVKPTTITTGSTILASVYGTNITKNQVTSTLAELKESNETTEDYTETEALDYLIYQVLLQRKAEELLSELSEEEVNYLVMAALKEISDSYNVTFSSNEQIELFLKTYYGMTVNDFANAVVPQYLIQSYVLDNYSDYLKSVEDFTEDDIIEFYNENKDSFKVGAFARVAHIYKIAGDTPEEDAANKAFMEQLYRQIRLGTTTFEKAASEHSDDSSSAKDGGLISGWLLQDSEIGKLRFGDDACKVIFNLGIGQYSPVTVGYHSSGDDEEPIKGYHIFKLIGLRPAMTLTLDDVIDPNYTTTVREYISNSLSQSVQSLNYGIAYNKMLSDLKEQSDLVYYN